MRMRAFAGMLACGALLLITGCGGFFSDPNGTTTTSSTGTTVGDYVYVVNGTTNTLSGFSLASGTLAPVSTTAYALTSNLAASSVTVSRADTYVFVGGNGAIYCYSIGSGGVLTAVSGGGTSTTSDVVSMTTSKDGQWLLALSSSTTTVAATVTVYGINATTGVLTQQSAVAVTFNSGSAIGTVAPKSIQIADATNLVAVALGTAGDAIFTFNTSTGVVTQTTNILPKPNGNNYNSDNSILFSGAGTALFVGTNGGAAGASYISTWSVNTAGAATAVSPTVTTGDAPNGMTMDSTGTHLYAANFSSGSITGYTYSATGTPLTVLSGSPFAASPSVTALVRDKSTDYIVAISNAGGVTTGANDVTLYGFDAYNSGQLDPIGKSTSGTDPAGSVAVAATY